MIHFSEAGEGASRPAAGGRPDLVARPRVPCPRAKDQGFRSAPLLRIVKEEDGLLALTGERALTSDRPPRPACPPRGAALQGGAARGRVCRACAGGGPALFLNLEDYGFYNRGPSRSTNAAFKAVIAHLRCGDQWMQATCRYSVGAVRERWVFPTRAGVQVGPGVRPRRHQRHRRAAALGQGGVARPRVSGAEPFATGTMALASGEC